jgi:competence protein ComGF
MTIKLNLLPPELAVDKKTGSILKSVRAFNLILTALFVIFTIGLSAYFIFASIMLKNKLASVDSLKNKIKTLQTSEQQMVLLKDRIKKINIAQAKSSSLKNLDAIIQYVYIITGIPDNEVL